MRWWCLHQGIDLDGDQVDEQQITEAVAEFFTGDHFDIGVDPDHPSITADGEDISEAIRSSEVSSHVSKVSNVIPGAPRAHRRAARLHCARVRGRLLLAGPRHRRGGP